MYNVQFAKSFVKDMKKISKELQKEVLEKWIPKIQDAPAIGGAFRGRALNGFLKLPFRYKKNDYRIVYQVRKKEILIVFLAVGSRENFYKKLNRKL